MAKPREYEIEENQSDALLVWMAAARGFRPSDLQTCVAVLKADCGMSSLPARVLRIMVKQWFSKLLFFFGASKCHRTSLLVSLLRDASAAEFTLSSSFSHILIFSRLLSRVFCSCGFAAFVTT